MRSSKACTHRVFAALCAAGALLCLAPVQAQQAAPTRSDVQTQADALRADPDMPGTARQRTLRLKDSVPKPNRETQKQNSQDLSWLRSFSLWLGEAGRVTVWVIGAIAVVLLLLSLRHVIRLRANRLPARAGAGLPSHVHALDIRPQSLPEQVGEAARQLWLRGEHREALSLLYRGALSRLVHAHAVPINASSTEGECVVLAAVHLSPERSAFFGHLVDVWRLAVYGQRLPETPELLQLCSAFDQHFGTTVQGAELQEATQ